MVNYSNSRPVLGAAIMLHDLDEVEGLNAFIRDKDRDVELQDLSGIDALGTDCSPYIEKARKAFAGHAGRIGLHGPYYGFLLDAADSELRGIVKKRLQASFEACIEIAPNPGAAHIVVHSPISTWDWYNHENHPGAREAQIMRVHECLGHIVKPAEDEGVTIVIENCEDKDPVAWRELVASFDSPAVRASLDTGHAHYAHGVTGAPPVDYFVRAAGELLSHVHVQDADGFADRHWRIGSGTVNWAAVFRALDDLPEMPRLMLELADPRDIQPSALWLAEQGLAR